MKPAVLSERSSIKQRDRFSNVHQWIVSSRETKSDNAVRVDETAVASRSKNAIEHVRSILWSSLLPIGIVLTWTLASTQHWIPAVFLPTPLRTAFSFWDMLLHQSFLHDFWVSISLVLQSFVYGAVVAILLGFAAGLSKPVERFFGPTLDTIRHIPGVAWFPLIVLWLGVGAPAKTLVIAKTVFFPVFLNTLQGMRNADAKHVELGTVLTLNRFQLLRHILIPSALPTIIVSLRYSAGLAWAMVVVAEGLAGQEGIGFLIFRAQSLLMTDQLLVCMVTIGLVGFAIDRGMFLMQRRALKWKVSA